MRAICQMESAPFLKILSIGPSMKPSASSAAINMASIIARYTKYLIDLRMYFIKQI